MHSRKSSSGITIVELLFALAVAAILFGFAGNAVSAAMNAARTGNGLASLVAALTQARSIAAAEGIEVVLCPSSDGGSCSNADHWESGWIAFQAIHGTGEREADEPIVLRQPALPAQVHLVSTTGRTRIRFQPSGGNLGSNATFTFCDGRGARAASAYALSNAGNLHATDTRPENVDEACAGL
jgi:type IV fimbrial biogenesis protein FimT